MVFGGGCGSWKRAGRMEFLRCVGGDCPQEMIERSLGMDLGRTGGLLGRGGTWQIATANCTKDDSENVGVV